MRDTPPSSFEPLTFDLGDVFGRFRTETSYANLTPEQVSRALATRTELPQDLVIDLVRRDANSHLHGLTIRGYDALAELHHALSDALTAYTGS